MNTCYRYAVEMNSNAMRDIFLFCTNESGCDLHNDEKNKHSDEKIKHDFYVLPISVGKSNRHS
jgi:hypothetical protein